MASVTLKNVSKSFGVYDIIRNVDLEIADGEFVVFVGPSGCGKSTLLRLIAGLVPVSDGAVLIGGDEVTDVPASKRGISFVFQSYALYPHMNVSRNISFALETARIGKAEIARKLEAVASMLKIGHLLERKPRQLSGGQRQRVAIGRALVADPDVFLFDEPLSNLDADLRTEMRFEIAKLHAEVKTTMIYVTHDQTEAMTLADRIVVLNHGKVEQTGTPRELYDRPATRFVAGFLGSPKMNFAPTVLTDGRLAGPDGFSYAPGLATGTAASEIGLRPEALALSAQPGSGTIEGIFERQEDLGHEYLCYVRIGEGLIWTVRGSGAPPAFLPGQSVHVGWRAENLYLFDRDGQRLDHRPAGRVAEEVA
ncbi:MULTISPECIES: ABC transporter ATP-binding protein [unclassified Ensifer]|uniref:ABC transporter ATP-binding protein n=1 Tax=unclassified Ensifer TaxID=2633371 RepID=UPI00087FFCF7|nr:MULTISPECIES: ABC transporter ATP-binding protein [unclassified Ensifer]MBD9596301.1 ABC transporter ATP-binding protein [Ensifer sp. ENS05]SDN18065.1 carbohydrate ABC transporter ATP-binding protein, CUT1 family (TC 3.A.1.1.-) [Ensifer sp. YR511]